MLFAQKVYAIMVVCVLLFITDRSASAQLDLLAKNVRLTLMNVQVSLVIMAVNV